MEQIRAEFIDKMGDDLRAANIARVSFANWKEEFDEKDARLIDAMDNRQVIHSQNQLITYLRNSKFHLYELLVVYQNLN